MKRKKKGGGMKEKKKKKRSPSNFQITAKNKAKAAARGGAGRGEHGEVQPHQRRGAIRAKDWLRQPLMLARTPRPAGRDTGWVHRDPHPKTRVGLAHPSRTRGIPSLGGFYPM